MKTIKTIQYISIAALTSLMVACSTNDEALNNNFPSDGAVHITTTVGEPLSRADATYTNYKGTNLGLYIINNHNSNYNYSNIKWTSAAGVWSPSSQMLWQNATTPVLVYAYAPYQENANLSDFVFSVNTDQSTNGSLSSDFVSYSFSGTESSPFFLLDDKGSIPVKFDHALEQVIVNLSFADEFGTQTPAVSNVQMVNFNTSCHIGIQDAQVTKSSSPKNVLMYPDVVSSKYSAVVPSQSIQPNVAMFKITLTDGREFIYAPTTTMNIFMVGSSYTYNLRIGKNKVSLASNISVSDWDEDAGIRIYPNSDEANELIDVANHQITTLNAGSITAADVKKVAPSGTQILYIEGPVNAADLKTIVNNTTNLLVNLLNAKLDNSDGLLTNLDLTRYNTLFYVIDASYATSSLALSWKLDDNNKQLQYLGKKLTLTYNYPYPNISTKVEKEFMVSYISLYHQELPYAVLLRISDTATSFADGLADILEREHMMGYNDFIYDRILYNLKNKKISIPDGLYWLGDESQIEWKSTYTTPIHIEKANVTTTTAKTLYYSNFNLHQ